MPAVPPVASAFTSVFAARFTEWQWPPDKNFVCVKRTKSQTNGESFQDWQGPCSHRGLFSPQPVMTPVSSLLPREGRDQSSVCSWSPPKSLWNTSRKGGKRKTREERKCWTGEGVEGWTQICGAFFFRLNSPNPEEGGEFKPCHRHLDLHSALNWKDSATLLLLAHALQWHERQQEGNSGVLS